MILGEKEDPGQRDDAKFLRALWFWPLCLVISLESGTYTGVHPLLVC